MTPATKRSSKSARSGKSTRAAKAAKPKRAAKRRRAITPEDLAAIVTVASPQISPDGSRIVFVKKHVGEKNKVCANLWMADVDGGEARAFTNGDADGHPRWSPDGSQIAFLSSRVKRHPQIWVIDADGGEARALTDFPEGSVSGFKWSPDGSRFAVSFREQDPEWTEEAEKHREEHGLSTPARVLDDWYYRLDGDGYFNAQRHAVYLVDAESGAHSKLFDKDRLGASSYDWSPDGKQLALTANTDRKALVKPWKTELWRVNASNGRATRIPNLDEGYKAGVSWSPDGKLLAFAGTLGELHDWGTTNTDIFVCDPVKGRARNLTGREDYCLDAHTIGDMAEVSFEPVLAWSPDGKRLLTEFGWHGTGVVASVSRSGRGGFTVLTSGRQVVSVGNTAADGKTVALTVQSPDRPTEVAVGRLVSDILDVERLTDFNGAFLKEVAVAKTKTTWVRSPDGTRVQVWVMLPPNYKGRGKLPTVLEVHGGPHAQYGETFFHEFQCLAAAGYAVFYSNPRGSKGYGEDFCAAIKGDWGHKDWIDIQSVIGHMAESRFVDTNRMGIMGGSYGGYMTNWAIGHSDVFAGAITDRCVSNMISMLGSSDIMEEPDGYWAGNTWDDTEARWSQSPLRYFGNVKTPTLIIHSEGDLRCNVEQGEQVFAALKHLNVPTRFVRYPSSTSHGMSRGGPPDLRTHRLHQILEWWKRWLGK